MAVLGHKRCAPAFWVLLALVILTIVMMSWEIASAQSTTEQQAAWEPERPITIIVPSNPGGGWDQTARFMQRAIAEENLLPVSLEVVNRGGGAGTIALAEVVEQFEGDTDKLMITGFGMVGGALMVGSDYSLDQVTPIARLTGEFQVFAVAQDSPYQSIEALLADFKRDPKSISWGGGAAGNSDHVFLVQVAEALGIPAADVNYVAFTGGGEVNAALMGQQVTAAINGFGEISGIAESGRIRLLAVSSPTRIVDEDLPTFVESGVDLTFQNWRGIVAPPGLTQEEQAYFVDLVTRVNGSASWRETLARNNWQDSFLVGDEFERFLTDNREQTAQTLAAIGLGGGNAAFAIGPELFPQIVLIGLIVSGLLIAMPHLRARFAGESQHAQSDREKDGPSWIAFAGILGFALSYIFALAWVGFVIATPVYVFGVSQMIQRGNYVRDGIIALAMTGTIYLIFERLLNVSVP